MRKRIKKYFKNAFKVYSGQKPYHVVAELTRDVAKRCLLPPDIVVKRTFFEKMAQAHPKIDKNQLFSFIKTLNIPKEIYQTSKENRLNFFRDLEDKSINLVSTGQDLINPQQNVITSFFPKVIIDAKARKYVLKIKNTSKKVFPIESGGAGNSSSNMLSQVPGAGARLPRSSKSVSIIPKNENI